MSDSNPVLLSKDLGVGVYGPLALHKAVDRSCANACTRAQTARPFPLTFCSLSPLANKRTWGPFRSQIR
ncbi:unnamed protein product [Rangifer tarandus platyrhynchus]|uniref:Uncharacterized protein n=1 Tax=Rangifer tarandus platyrhynchus TaxID=3082113 RepID=A0AC59Z2C9_RANTA